MTCLCCACYCALFCMPRYLNCYAFARDVFRTKRCGPVATARMFQCRVQVSRDFVFIGPCLLARGCHGSRDFECVLLLLSPFHRTSGDLRGFLLSGYASPKFLIMLLCTRAPSFFSYALGKCVCYSSVCRFE